MMKILRLLAPSILMFLLVFTVSGCQSFRLGNIDIIISSNYYDYNTD